MWHLRQKWANLLQLILLLSPSDHFGCSAEKEVWQVLQAIFKSPYSQRGSTITKFHIKQTHFYQLLQQMSLLDKYLKILKSQKFPKCGKEGSWFFYTTLLSTTSKGFVCPDG